MIALCKKDSLTANPSRSHGKKRQKKANFQPHWSFLYALDKNKSLSGQFSSKFSYSHITEFHSCRHFIVFNKTP